MLSSDKNKATQVKLVKCGSSYAVIVPATIVAYLGLKSGDEAQVKLVNDSEIVYTFKVKRQLSLIKLKTVRKKKNK